jgi:hypothetical protein
LRPISFTTIALAGADTNYIAESQTPLGAGNLTLTAAAAALVSTSAKPRYGLLISIDCAGADAGRTFTVTGTAPGGATQSETMAGSNGSQTLSTLYYESVTSIAVDAATAGAVIAGIRQTGATAWMPLDIYDPNSSTAISVNITGTLNYSVQYTNEDPFDTSITPVAISHPVAALVAASADQIGQTVNILRAVRLLINSGSGTALMTIVQQSTK